MSIPSKSEVAKIDSIVKVSIEQCKALLYLWQTYLVPITLMQPCWGLGLYWLLHPENLWHSFQNFDLTGIEVLVVAKDEETDGRLVKDQLQNSVAPTVQCMTLAARLVCVSFDASWNSTLGEVTRTAKHIVHYLASDRFRPSMLSLTVMRTVSSSLIPTTCFNSTSWWVVT